VKSNEGGTIFRRRRTREKIIILDFGGPEGMLVARRVREAQVYCELLPFNTSWAEIRRHQPRGLSWPWMEKVWSKFQWTLFLPWLEECGYFCHTGNSA